MHTIF